jgi:hypothetical protein
MGVKIVVKNGVTYWEEDVATLRKMNKQIADSVKKAEKAKAKAEKA